MNPTPSTKEKKRISRRAFFARGGMVLGAAAFGIYFGRGFLRRQITGIIENLDLPSGIYNFRPDFWFEILSDNTVRMNIMKVEMGQGVFTGLAMIAAEELEVEIDRIKPAPASTATGIVDLLGTNGSMSTMSLYTPVRETAATMREMLKLAAAKIWEIAPQEMQTRDGTVVAGSRSMTYAEIAAATTTWEFPETPPLKPASSFTIIGREVKRIDLRPKVMGEGLYSIDQELPGMLYATVLHSPYLAGTLKTADTGRAETHPGVVKIVREKDWIGVIAESRYAAEMGRRHIEAAWDAPRLWQQEELEALISVGNGTAVTIQKSGSPHALDDADGGSIISAEYRTPMLSHAQIEPRGTIAHVEGNRALIVTGTQNPNHVRNRVASALKMNKNDVEIRATYLGGGFGGRYMLGNAVEAAMLSIYAGAPVHVFNTREDEFSNAYYKPPTHHRLHAKLSDSGRVLAIEHQMATSNMLLEYFGPIAEAVLGADTVSAGHGARWMYPFENRLARVWDVDLPFQTGIWRGIGMVPNSFAMECFIDELAQRAGIDPIQFRLYHLTDDEHVIERMRKVLETLRDIGKWHAPKAEGIGRGMACAEDRKSLAAAIVEVQIVEGAIRVTRVVQVVDPGFVINPDGVRAQVEGAVMMGISAAMYEGLTIRDGRVAATNYHQYPMATMKDTPASVEVVMLQGSEKPYGVGEPPLAPMAPAIANAIFDLTGERKRRLPLLAAGL